MWLLGGDSSPPNPIIDIFRGFSEPPNIVDKVKREKNFGIRLFIICERKLTLGK
jgi:hypothetical protein